jgi:hypothetical protein
MGSCCSREENSYDDETDANEHTRLIIPINADPPEHTLSSSPPLTSFTRSNEHDILSKILHQTATAFIDISVMDGGTLYQQEQRTRAIKYSERLDGLLGSLSIPMSPVHLPPGVVNPMPVLMSPLSTSDVDMVLTVSCDLDAALETMRPPQVKDLTVCF